MAKSNSLGRAKDAKQDEFYTQLADIENELRHYRPHFKGKTVLCNCDDPYESNFFKYFALNFNKLKLKKLIATCYSGSPITGTQLSLFGDETEDGRRTPYKAVVTTVHDTTGEGGIDMLDVAELFRTGENTIEQLHSDGDFRSPECLELLDESDIVVTMRLPPPDGGTLRCEKGLGTALLQGGPPHQGPPGRMAGVHRGTARMGPRDEKNNRGDRALKTPRQ